MDLNYFNKKQFLNANIGYKEGLITMEEWLEIVWLHPF